MRWKKGLGPRPFGGAIGTPLPVQPAFSGSLQEGDALTLIRARWGALFGTTETLTRDGSNVIGTVTDPGDGTWIFPAAAAGLYAYSATRSGQTLGASAIVEADVTEPSDLTATITPNPPVAGTEFALTWTSEEPADVAVTLDGAFLIPDVDGRYLVPAGGGMLVITGSRPGYTDFTATFEVEPAEVPAGDLVTTDPDATMLISATGNGEERAVTLASTTHGSFTRTYANAAALTEALAEGPIYFGGLKVNGIPKSGNTVTGQNGLWLYDDNHGAVAFTREWPVNGVPLAGQNGPSLVMDSTMLNTVGYRQIVTQGALPPVAATSPLVPIRLVTTFDAPQNTRLGTFADEFGQQFSTVSGDNLGAYILPNKTVTGNGNLWLVRRTAQDFGSRQYAEGYFIQSNAALDNHSGLGLVLCVNPTAKTALMVSLNIRDNAFGPAESILVHSVSWATGSFVRTYLGSVGTPSESWVDANQRLTLLAEYDNGPLRLFADGSLMGTIDVASGLTGGAGLARVVGPASPSLLSVQIDNFACGVLT